MFLYRKLGNDAFKAKVQCFDKTETGLVHAQTFADNDVGGTIESCLVLA